MNGANATRLDGNVLRFNEIGSYKLGLFFSESRFGVPWEATLFSPGSLGNDDDPFTGVGPMPGGLAATVRRIVVLHETSHYVHDLSLGACIERDLLLDHSAGLLFLALRALAEVGPVPCPLVSRGHWATLTSSKHPVSELLRGVALSDELAHGLLDVAMPVPTGPPAPNFGLPSAEPPRYLSGTELLEGIVAVKTACELARRCRSDADVEYLRKAEAALPLLPERLPPLYSAARRLFAHTIGPLNAGMRHLDAVWPEQYTQSSRGMTDVGFLLLADIACHVPPFEIATPRITEGTNTADDFHPAARFIKALQVVRSWRGFPEADDPANPSSFYRQLYNALATHPSLNWPTLDEVGAAWLDKLDRYKRHRRSASDGYRFRLSVERAKDSLAVVIGDPVQACRSQAVPIFHLTPSGMKVLLGSGRMYAPLEAGAVRAYDALTADVRLWDDVDPQAGTTGIEDQRRKLPLFEQEIVARTLCRAVQRAVMREPFLTCPFAHAGCDAAVPPCARITDPDALPAARCSLRKYLESNGLLGSIRWHPTVGDARHDTPAHGG